MENEQIIRQVAREVGVAEHIALAFAQAESNGRMVYGHDAGGTFSTRDAAVTVDGIEWPKGSNIPVTDASFRELERRVAAGEKSNGVGIMQITYRGFFPDARKKGFDLATATDNIRYGLTLIRGYLAAAPEGVDPLTYAASRYNRGSVYSGPYHYTDRVNAYARAWALLEPKETRMRIALIHSNQPGNQYAGGPAGVEDSEQAWMRKLALQLVALLGAEVIVGPVGPTFATNVDWVNTQHRVRPFDLVLSLHSNAAGDSMVLWGTSKASERYGRTIMDALNAAKILPFGDTWTYYDRKVAEVAKTAPPAVLLEVGRHDTLEYAQWLRDHITDGSLARQLARPLNRALGLTPPADPLAATTPLEDTVTLSDADIDRIADAVWKRLITVPDGSQVNAGTALGGLRNDLRSIRGKLDDEFRRTMGV